MSKAGPKTIAIKLQPFAPKNFNIDTSQMPRNTDELFETTNKSCLKHQTTSRFNYFNIFGTEKILVFQKQIDLTINNKACYICCKKNSPPFKVTNGNEKYDLCDSCVSIIYTVNKENKENKIDENTKIKLMFRNKRSRNKRSRNKRSRNNRSRNKRSRNKRSRNKRSRNKRSRK
jgi:hypothetical protein